MNISTDLLKSFIDEIRFVVGKMESTSDTQEKLYFFSAVFGQAQRIINFEYDPELLFINQVTQLVHNMINSRSTLIKLGQDATIPITDGLFESLEGALGELADSLEKKSESYSALQKMVTAAYTTTGNGHYMYLKGKIKL